jgi:hypothetical protein
LYLINYRKNFGGIKINNFLSTLILLIAPLCLMRAVSNSGCFSSSSSSSSSSDSSRGEILPPWSTLKVMVELKGDKYVLWPFIASVIYSMS